MIIPCNVKDWECSDDDCWQYWKQSGRRTYKFIQAVWLDTDDDKNYAIVAQTIDLEEFSLEDIEMAIYGFYDSISDMEEKYNLPIGKLDQLVAECYFENNCLQDSWSLGGTYTEEEATKVIYDYLNKN